MLSCYILKSRINMWHWYNMTFPGGTKGKEPACQCRRHETQVQPLCWEDPLEEGMATNAGILAWRNPRTEEPGGLCFIESQRIRHDWSDLACTHIHRITCYCYMLLLINILRIYSSILFCFIQLKVSVLRHLKFLKYYNIAVNSIRQVETG